jgi:hypothetical protein
LRQELSFPHPDDVKKKAAGHTRSSSTTVELFRSHAAKQLIGRAGEA